MPLMGYHIWSVLKINNFEISINLVQHRIGLLEQAINLELFLSGILPFYTKIHANL